MRAAALLILLTITSCAKWTQATTSGLEIEDEIRQIGPDQYEVAFISNVEDSDFYTFVDKNKGLTKPELVGKYATENGRRKAKDLCGYKDADFQIETVHESTVRTRSSLRLAQNYHAAYAIGQVTCR